MTGTTRRVAAGAGWLYGYRWIERLLDLAALVILARLLSPEDFGVVAIAASVVAIIDGLSDFDVNRALIRTRDEHPRLYDTAWTLSALRGLLAALLMVGVALLLPTERIATVLMALAATPLVRGLANPLFVAFERDLIYSRLAGLTLGSKVVSVAVTLVLAWLTRSYWALVAGILVGALVTTLLTFALRPYLPRPSLERWRQIFAFSGWMSLATMVTTLAMETDKIIVGRLLGVADAGLYFMTQRVGVLPTRELISPLQRILFPSFSEIVADRPRLRRVVTESINVFASLALPVGCGFALIAADLVPLALGETWRPIVGLLVILVPFLGLRATLSMTLPCVMALGETRLLFRVSVIYALVHVPAFIAGTALYGLTGAFASIVVAGLFYTWLNAWMLRRTLGISIGEIARALQRPAAATLLMVAAVLAVASLPALATMVPWLVLLIKIAVGGGVFSTAQYSIWRLAGRPPGIERRLLQLLGR